MRFHNLDNSGAHQSWLPSVTRMLPRLYPSSGKSRQKIARWLPRRSNDFCAIFGIIGIHRESRCVGRPSKLGEGTIFTAPLRNSRTRLTKELPHDGWV